MFDLLISNCDALVYRDGRYGVDVGRDVAIAQGRIAAIEPTGVIVRSEAHDQIDAAGALAIPGLINCHAHVPMVLFRGLAEDVPIESWFNDYIWPLESNEEPEDIYWGMLLGIAEMILNGVTTVAEHYFFCDEIARAVSESGVRANIGWAVFGHEGLAKLDRTAQFVSDWQGKADGRITTWMAPHSPYLCDHEFLRATVERAKDLNVGIHIHCSETHDQRELSLERYGLTPPQMLHKAGVLEVPTLLAHGIGITQDDIVLLKDFDVAVAQCPKTYLKLAMGTALVQAFREAGIKVGLGTDGVVSSNTLDVLEQMRVLALDQKQAAKSSTAMPLQDVLDIAFRGSAQAVRQPELGELAVGKWADVALLRQDGPHVFPRYNALANLVYSHKSSDVDTVICQGKLLLHRGKLLTIDLDLVKREVGARLQRLNQRVKEKRLATYPS
jgi:5-methylthioadenosine/S-adenosylhomocysteine deaminase